MRFGVRLGIDVGRSRIGVARCDADGLLAVPIETVARSSDEGDSSDITRIVHLAAEYDAQAIIVGLPLSLSGAETASTQDARGFARRLAEAVPTAAVRLVDERLSTVTAQSALHRSGRSTRGSRAVIDQVAAVVILQHAIDSERSGGPPAPLALEPNEGPLRDRRPPEPPRRPRRRVRAVDSATLEPGAGAD
ncbi:Holliday junction resolvase RuvX [Rathayibacter iranicus]|uniref:Putative pre-16S rRNA nuclease n=1 Tax=Rathayibacter iranicus TaxID=59737 RepID=A0AAD1ENZ7_9MICO|nr:Holliday junction resolvase RuvX [Rathayibacter iranicus]MWV32512.1 Holliday junction resolvase RuvX [Rathayibacter iranicus NCPPB 2253 = VKM Ac-1602]PPI50124.1 Holliday junction resolvase RuvX [Rathayibacter iranicus]PPI61898.1 Holliday junction resolvase RuvX [Rathayibacter iranicus]PPI73607.1 Holliday junction resolvase RuvX [Rathayibacter iranicus]